MIHAGGPATVRGIRAIGLPVTVRSIEQGLGCVTWPTEHKINIAYRFPPSLDGETNDRNSDYFVIPDSFCFYAAPTAMKRMRINEQC
jgi:hypothetical protein